MILGTDEFDWPALMAEELDPELEQWVEDGAFGRSLKHPLVYEIGAVVPGLANRRLAHKRERLAEAIAEADWHTVVFLHERAWRADALLRVATEHADQLTDAAYWRLVGQVWIDSENIWQNTLEWDALLGSERGERTAMMSAEDDEDDLAQYAALPETVTVYRGAHAGINEEGLSWTTDRAKAVWFARRYAEIREGEPIVLVGTVAKADVIAYLTGRGESEVVVTEGSVTVERVEDA